MFHELPPRRPAGASACNSPRNIFCTSLRLPYPPSSLHPSLVLSQATNDHYVIGLKILNQLVEEINIPTSGRTLPQHRKTAVSFRDLCLLPIFQVNYCCTALL